MVAGLVELTVLLREEGPPFRQAGHDVLALLQVGRPAGRDREPGLGQVDGGLEQLGERDLPEALVRGLHPCHEPGHHHGSPARSAVGWDRQRVVLLEERRVAAVHVVDLAGGRVEVQHRNLTGEAGGASHVECGLGQRRGHDGVGSAAALFQHLVAGVDGKRAGGAGDHPLAPLGKRP